jgi:hypothetical protein
MEIGAKISTYGRIDRPPRRGHVDSGLRHLSVHFGLEGIDNPYMTL